MSNIEKIGVIDAGLGGLTVVKRLLNINPALDIIYLADTRNMPYTGTEQWIHERGRALMSYIRQHVHKIIIGCNTLSTVISDDKDDVVKVTATLGNVLSSLSCDVALILGTSQTISSGIYQRALAANPGVRAAVDVPCRELGVTIEQHGLQADKIRSIVRNNVRIALRNTQIPMEQTVNIILACTHYPLIDDVIIQVVAEELKNTNCSIVNPVDYFNVPDIKSSHGTSRITMYINAEGEERYCSVIQQVLQKLSISASETHFINI